MANGTLTLYNKLTNALYVDLVIQGTFNIEDNLNDTPSNMKIKTTTSSTYREEFEVNTVAWHEDTDTWWVIKSDTSTYITTGEYEHEIELVEYLEFYGYRHLPNCAFAPNTYTLEQMLQRLFNIAKISVGVEYANFLDKDKLMPFMSFENYTVSNAIKTISRAIDAIPKMYVDTTPIYQPKLYFINRVGLDTPVVNGLNTNFPTQFEKNTNSSDQFTTRAIANIQNAKSSNLIIAPKLGGFKNFVPNDIVFNDGNRDTARIFAPSKIDRIEYINIFVPIELKVSTNGASVSTLFKGYYTNKKQIEDIIDSTSLSEAIKNTAKSNLPNQEKFYRVNYNSEIDVSYSTTDGAITSDDSMFFKKMNLLNKFEFDTASKTVDGVQQADNDTKDRTIHWIPFTNEIIMSKSFRNGLTGFLSSDHNREFVLAVNPTPGTEPYVAIKSSRGVLDTDVVFNEKILIQLAYYPISDIKVSIDNDNEAQDEKFFNQNGKVIDALSATKLVFSHTQDSVNGTKIRNARYDDLEDVLPLGQLVREGNDLYVIAQRSLDLLITDEHEWVNAIYTLTKNRIGRSENITADSSVISYKTPDDNLVNRSQLYKDYIELSLENNNQEQPYMPMSKALVFNDTLAGTNFDYTVLVRSGFGPLVELPSGEFEPETMLRYVKNPSPFDLHKSKLMNVNWQENNVLGFRFQRVSGTLTQTPIVYTDNFGRATNFELLFVNEEQIRLANADYNDPTELDVFVPFSDLTDVPLSFYSFDIINDNRFDIRIQEPQYDKDGFEIPVFEYMVQANDDYSPLGNVVVGDELFSTFTGTLRYHYVRNDETRFTSENAKRLYTQNPPLIPNSRRVTFARSTSTPHILDLDLFSTFSSVRNSQPITNIGIYATDGTTVKFLFAINDYVASGINDLSNIRVFINNWKI
jgi:hypothetical protein